jgi:UDP-N-acetyl-D-glucosamine dehydrogenase
LIAVTTPLNAERKPELRMLISACKLFASVLVDQSLVINESTSYIGTLRNLIKPAIESISLAKNISYAVATERIDPGNT